MFHYHNPCGSIIYSVVMLNCFLGEKQTEAARRGSLIEEDMVRSQPRAGSDESP